ncbi:MAG: CRISPR-associated endonuclease Cas2 [Syntrophobacteraceae bacterium]|nr:CRISPR-associated endonuclease Cas2 [Syntrophobacteraceae bacterium]
MYMMVSYDIVRDATRGRVMRFLKDFGQRVQLSVFECDLDEEKYREMKRGVEELIDKRKDSVRYYRLCRQCVARVVVSGWGEGPSDSEFEIV